ncbi:adrenocortical dysplasia protein homolog isoform X2 [Athene cunicularia]|uniref:adrenocortical dysplasia protein homolog isoform X2 n=1 Tax=Athene cunicularia TaxID=194338 RepID=UPI000EF68996|nr:adrenocortical dysplasia protein homolog isoform X2 [Athene cunicularia]
MTRLWLGQRFSTAASGAPDWSCFSIHMQVQLSSLICRIIILQKYTVCFREEARLEDCEFYLTTQQFIVLPMERQRIESSNGNKEPSVMQKIKELWLRSLALKNAPSSEPSISQLIDAIGQNQLEVLKENAEKCLDLHMQKEVPVVVKDEVPITQWEAQRKEEKGEDVFTVPANTLVIPSKEEAVGCDDSKADTSKATAGNSGDDGTVSGDLSVAFQASPTESTALSESSEDNPWNNLPPISLTLNSSDEKNFTHDVSLNAEEDVAADSNTPDLLEPCSQDSSEAFPQGELVQTSSPSLLCSYSNTSPVETGTPQAASAVETACDASSAAQGPQVSGGSQAAPPSLSPALSILPGSHLQSLPEGTPHRERADSSGTAFPPDTLKCGPACARSQGGDAAGAKRKLPVGDGKALPALDGPQHSGSDLRGKGRDGSRKLEPVSTQRAKKSRKEGMELQHRKELSEEEEEEEEEEEQASPATGPSSRPEQHRALQPYVHEKPVQYRYEAPSPELCKQIRSVRISKAVLQWACWMLTEREMDS